MKLEKFNPFVTARLNAGYKSQDKLAQVIGVKRSTYSQWESGKWASVYDHNLTGFKKMCDIFGWTYEEGLNNLSNLNKWRKDPNIHIVKPFPAQARSIAKSWKPELTTLDTSNTDISKELEMLDNPLKVWRGKQNLTRSEAAKLCHVDVNVYSDCEDGVKKPNGYDLTKILHGTGLGFVDIQKIFSDDTVKKVSIQLCDEIDHNKVIEDIVASSKPEVAYVEKPEEPKPTVSYGKLMLQSLQQKVEIEDPYGNTYQDVLEPDPEEPEVIASPITPEEFTALNDKEVHEKMDEVITERDENGKPVAGRYIFEDSDGHAKLTREGERKVAEYTAKLRSQLTAASMAEDFARQKALNEPHDFRDEVIDEVLEKMYGQMDYKKYVYLVGLLGR